MTYQPYNLPRQYLQINTTKQKHIRQNSQKISRQASSKKYDLPLIIDNQYNTNSQFDKRNKDQENDINLYQNISQLEAYLNMNQTEIFEDRPILSQQMNFMKSNIKKQQPKKKDISLSGVLAMTCQKSQNRKFQKLQDGKKKDLFIDVKIIDDIDRNKQNIQKLNKVEEETFKNETFRPKTIRSEFCISSQFRYNLSTSSKNYVKSLLREQKSQKQLPKSSRLKPQQALQIDTHPKTKYEQILQNYYGQPTPFKRQNSVGFLTDRKAQKTNSDTVNKQQYGSRKLTRANSMKLYHEKNINKNKIELFLDKENLDSINFVQNHPKQILSAKSNNVPSYFPPTATNKNLKKLKLDQYKKRITKF